MVYRLSNWASKQVLFAGWSLLVAIFGAIPLFFYTAQQNGIPGPPLAGYALIMGAGALAFHYPLKSMGRLLLMLQSSYFANCIACVVFSIPLLLNVPTFLAGISMITAAGCYAIAGFRGEEKLTIEQVLKGWR